MSILILSAQDVDSIVSHFTPKDLQLLMAQVFSSLQVSKGDVPDTDSNSKTSISVSMPHRLSIPMLNHTALFMPARVGGGGGGGSTQSTSSSPSPNRDDSLARTGNTAIKVVCVPHDSSRSSGGLPGTTVILDENTGAVNAVVNARKLTALRNAAGSLLSTTLLAVSQPEAIVAFGAGQQIESHLDLFLCHFSSSITRCRIVNRSRNDRALSLHKKISDKYISVNVDFQLLVPTPESDAEFKKALGGADIIICATSSTIPLFPSSYVKDGTHIILIGSYKPEMKEVDTDLISRSLKGTLLVDSRESCLREAGELIDACVRPEELMELGQLLPVDGQGDLDVRAFEKMMDGQRRRERKVDSSAGSFFVGPVSIFKSVGLGIQDVAITEAVVQKALDSKLNGKIGTVIPNYDSDV